MIHNIDICKECHYMKIKDYSCRERHCKKCDNYGQEKRLKSDVMVIQKPVKARIYCPHCEEELMFDYEKFIDYMGSEYPGDWRGETLDCPNCNNEIEIEDAEMD